MDWTYTCTLPNSFVSGLYSGGEVSMKAKILELISIFGVFFFFLMGHRVVFQSYSCLRWLESDHH